MKTFLAMDIGPHWDSESPTRNKDSYNVTHSFSRRDQIYVQTEPL